MIVSLNPLNESPQTMVLLAKPHEAARLTHHFSRLGWQVHTTRSNAKARRLARTLNPHIVVLDTAVLEESGWLTSAKMHFQLPSQSIVLLSDAVGDSDRDYAEFVGAGALLERSWDPEMLAAEIRHVIESAMECSV